MSLFTQADSLRHLESRIMEEVNDRFPREVNGHTLRLEGIKFNYPYNYQNFSDSIAAQQQAYQKDETPTMTVTGTLVVEKDGKVDKPFQNAILARMPFITNRGTYIIQGNEMTFINRSTQRDGVYVNPVQELANGEVITASVRIGKTRFQLMFNKTNFKFTINGIRSAYANPRFDMDLLVLLRMLGATEGEVQSAIGNNEVYENVKKESTRSRQTVADVFRKMFPKDTYRNEEEAKEKIKGFFENKLAFDEETKQVVKETIGTDSTSFDKQAILNTMRQMVREYEDPESNLISEDIRFKKVETGEDMLAEGFGTGLDRFLADHIEEALKERSKTKIRPRFINEWVEKVYRESSYREFADTPNPLALLQAKQKITALGERGVTSRDAKTYMRDLSDNAFAKIDPVETPQSKNMGLVQHLAKDVDVKDGTIHSLFYRVKNGTIDRSAVIDSLTPMQEYNEYIAFYDPRQVDTSKEPWTFRAKEVRVRHRGTFLNVPSAKVTLIDKSRDGLFGYATALIPFGSHNDGARMLMGANMQGQAIALKNAEVPLVQNIDDDGESIEKKVAEKASFLLKSPVSGIVRTIADDHIEIQKTDGSSEKVMKLNYFTTGKMGGYINHKPIVNVGDRVEAGQTLADGWQSKNGQLALGTNALTAYMPFDGYNFEDGVVISKSFADRLTSEEIKTLEFDERHFPDNVKVGTKETLDFFRKTRIVSESELRHLDSRGIVKVGTEINPGDILITAVKPSSESRLKRLPQMPLEANAWDASPTKRAEGYQKGKVLDVQSNVSANGVRIVIKLLAYKPMELGDKIAGRHGNKGIVTKILMDNEMPKTTEGKVVDIIFSPLAIPSRKNLGQLLEVNAGLVAMKKGLANYGVKNFDPSERDRLLRDLESIGLPDGKIALLDPKTGKPYENPVTVGPMYIMKLKHKVESKITRRNIEGRQDPMFSMPSKMSGSVDGNRTNPQGVGAMEFWSLTSAGAVQNIHEMNTLKSDGAGDRQARMTIFHALRRGETQLPDPVTPQTVKALRDYLTGANINMIPLKNGTATTLDEEFTSLMLQPLTPEAFQKLGAKPITKFHKSYEARRGGGGKDYVAGGLLDPEIFGKDGDQWGYFPLDKPLANPIFFKGAVNPYQVLLKYNFPDSFQKNDTIKQMMAGERFVILDPGDTDLKKYEVVTKERVRDLWDDGLFFDADTGSSALHELLKEVDAKGGEKIRGAYNEAANKLKAAKTLDQKTEAERDIRVLANMLDKNLKATDYLVHNVPILPTKYRPFNARNDVDIIDSLNHLYQRSVMQEKRFEETEENIARGFQHIDKKKIPVGKPNELPLRVVMDPEFYAKKEAQRFEALGQLYGTTAEYEDPKTGQAWRGIFHRFNNKSGFIRAKMQKKMQDYSGRSVIVVDPTLNLDEVSLPEDMARVMFDAQITRELERMGYTAQQVLDIKNNPSKYSIFKDVLKRVTKDHPVILNRQPTLHRHSVQAFYPVIRDGSTDKKNRAIGLNPLVTTGFNADFDGDTMAVHVPITEAAKQEAVEKLMPSQNLYNPTNNGLIMELKHEMQLGIYYMTRDVQPKGTAKPFKNTEELRKAYDKGQIETYDAAVVAGITSTVGKHLFNDALPAFARSYEKNIDIGKNKLQKLITSIVQHERGGIAEATKTLNKLRNLSFHVSTKSGMSIGVKDFQGVLDYRNDPKLNDNLFERAEVDATEKVKSEVDKRKEKGLVMDFIDQRDLFEQKKAEFVRKELEAVLKTKSPLSKDNPVTIMQMSGARGNAQQIAAMAGSVGVGRKVTNKDTRGIAASHLEGLSPDQFWDLAGDSRKGIFDKSIASQDPGYLTRQLWMANKQTMVTEKDCGDKVGIVLHLNNDFHRRALRGRILLKPMSIPGGQMVMVTGRPITLTDIEKINAYYDNAKSNKQMSMNVMVNVRSPLSCKSPNGVCQMCYGSKPGDPMNRLVMIGEPVGSLAAQAIGEPSQQAIMRTFHTGGASSGGNAFQRIRDILKLSNTQKAHMKAILSTVDGTVQKIEKDHLGNTNIAIQAKSGKIHTFVVPAGKPIDPTLVVNGPVVAGQSLTLLRGPDDKTYTYKDPKEVLQISGVGAVQQYLMDELNYALDKGDMSDNDVRHTEVIISNLTNKAIVERGEGSPFRTGQTVDRKVLDHYNEQAKKRPVTVSLDYASKLSVVGALAAETYHVKNSAQVIVQKGQPITENVWEALRNSGRKNIKIQGAPVAYKPELMGLSLTPQQFRTSPNWFNAAGFEHVRSAITTGAAVGANDPLDNPLTRQMAGKKPNISEEYEPWAKEFTNFF